MLRDQFPDLFGFFAGRFNQDWDLDAHDDSGVIELFLREEPPEFVNAVRSQIRDLIDLGLTEDALREALWRDLGCYYDPTPTGLSVTQWLRSVAVRLG